MLRGEAFGSGLPMLVASICLLVLAYVAFVRGERLARTWATAWLLLLVRYVVDTISGASTTPGETIEILIDTLRTGFALSVLAGVLALRGRPLAWQNLAVIVAGVTVTMQGLHHLPATQALLPWGPLVLMAMLLTTAAGLLARAPGLPAAERRLTAVALAGYAVSSALAPMATSGSTLFTSAFMGTMGAQILVTFGLFATFFRISHDAEIAAYAAREQGLTRALGEFVSVCMFCKSVRDDHDHWQPLEHYVSARGRSQLSHGLCPTCMETHYGAFLQDDGDLEDER